MKASQTIAVSVSSFLVLGMMTLSTGLALAQSGGGEKSGSAPVWCPVRPLARQTIENAATIGASTDHNIRKQNCIGD